MQIAILIPMRNIVLLAALAVVPQACFGQFYRDQVPSRLHCDEMSPPYPPPGDREFPDHYRSAPPCEKRPPEQPCDAPRPVPPPTPRPAPAPQPNYQETGYYQAAPRSGVVEGASGTFGFRGGALTLPRLRLELPSVELPSFYRASHGASMRIRESVAPWVSTGFQRITSAVSTPQMRSGDAAPPEEDAEPQPRSTADKECDALKAKYEEKIEELNRKLDECDRMRRSIEQSLCDQSKIVPNRFPTRQKPQCIPPGPGPAAPGQPQCPPGTEYGPLPAQQSQPHLLPAPPAGGAATNQRQPQTDAPAQEPQASLYMHSDRSPSGFAALRRAAPTAGERASLQRSIGSHPSFEAAAPQALHQVAGRSDEPFREANPNVVPVSHLGTPRANDYPRLKPLPDF